MPSHLLCVIHLELELMSIEIHTTRVHVYVYDRHMCRHVVMIMHAGVQSFCKELGVTFECA